MRLKKPTRGCAKASESDYSISAFVGTLFIPYLIEHPVVWFKKVSSSVHQRKRRGTGNRMEEFRNRETLLGKDLPLNHHETLQNRQHEGHRRRCQRATHLGEGEDLACVAMLVMRGVRVRVHDLLSIHHMIVPERSATYVQIAECAQNHKGNRAKAQTVWAKGSGHQLRLESERKKLRRLLQFLWCKFTKKR